MGTNGIFTIAVLLVGHLFQSIIAKQLQYKKMDTLDGAQHPISDELLLDSVQWIEEQLQLGLQRILIHCRAGIGRSGSVGVAYCFFKHPHWNYDQTLQYIWSKKADIYPHRNLQSSTARQETPDSL